MPDPNNLMVVMGAEGTQNKKPFTVEYYPASERKDTF